MWQFRYLINLLWLLPLLFVFLPAQTYGQQSVTCQLDWVVRDGDNLTQLADDYLGKASQFQAIIDATNAKAQDDDSYATVENADALRVGMKLCIPASGQSLPQATELPATATRRTTATFTPTPTPTKPAARPTPTATATLSVRIEDAQHLAISWMRQQKYPGSEITIEQQLESGANYYRYLTSYQSQGLKIYALLTVPGGEKPASGWPVIIFNHGYIPPEVYRTTERYVAYVDYLARNGYVVFRPDYRGHGSSEGVARGGYGNPDYTIDVLNALASVKAYPAVDPNRIGMWGHSMGGYITLRCMVIDKEIKAGVIWAGVVASYPDLVTKWKERNVSNIPERALHWRQEMLAQFGTPEQNPDFWAAISANSYLTDLSGPIQLHHGTEDVDVPIEFSASLYQELEAANQLAEYYVYEGDNHNLSDNFKLAMKRSLDFFDKYVEKAETP